TELGTLTPTAAASSVAADAVLDPGGRWAAFGHDGTVEVHAVADRTRVAALATSPATRLAFSPDGRTLAVAATTGADVFVEFWDPAAGALAGTARDLGHPTKITAMVYDQHAALLATGHASG